MPDGETVIPQLVGEETYKYLGSEMRTGWAEDASQKELRTKIKRKCRQLIGLIGRAPLLTHGGTDEHSILSRTRLSDRLLRTRLLPHVGGLPGDRERASSSPASA